MASMGDLYTSFKLLKQHIEHGSAAERAQAEVLLTSLREDFDWPRCSNWLMAGTRLRYEAKDLVATVTQHYGCNKPELIRATDVGIPVYSGLPILQVAGEKVGLSYLQILFDTNDDSETIIRTLEFVSNWSRNDIRVWTPEKTWREANPHRAAGFGYYYDVFHVVGSGGSNLDYPGCSRGVQYSPRSGRVKKLVTSEVIKP